MEASDTTPQDNVQESGTGGVQPPRVENNPTTADDVKELSAAFAEYRKEVAALREELKRHQPRVVHQVAVNESPEDREKARLAEIADHSHYCPGCGALGKYPQRCTGPDERPHRAIEMVSTDELGDDPANHTAAPDTDLDRLAA